MTLATGFPPLARPSARVLVLGSMPGARCPVQLRSRRVRKLVAQRVAVWDVLRCCRRPGSLDSSIVRGSEVANDFVRFFERHRRIRAVYFNGAKAEHAFRRHVLPLLDPASAALKLKRLPSTSPAHAGRSFQHKLRYWRRIKRFSTLTSEGNHVV